MVYIVTVRSQDLSDKGERTIKVKVCGITTVEDARLVAEAGADYIGVIVGIDVSPRQITIEQARPICEQSPLPVVNLFFNRDVEQIREAVAVLKPHAVQLLGQETPVLVRALTQTIPCQIWKSVHLPPVDEGEADISTLLDTVNSLVDAGIHAALLDTVVSAAEEGARWGGTGRVNNWTAARRLVEVIPVPTFLAGGINPDNVREAIETTQPYGIDLCSGVEISKGHKDPEKLRRLMLAVREAVPEGS
ncbi:MAG TPA: phosphoribosylanthranilate isomerase [Dehalococcoidales bacterium]|nr:phosphoribosylanthranilate isomerase [Dehalococcoidales bacterium]